MPIRARFARYFNLVLDALRPRMRLRAGTLALTTPELAKQASLLYDHMALLQVKAPCGYYMDEEEQREFKDWCVQIATLEPNKEFLLFDYRDPTFLVVGENLLKVVTSSHRNQYVVRLISGESDLLTDLDNVVSPGAQAKERNGSGSNFARILLDKVRGVVSADWEQIREFRRDKEATSDYRGILYLHQKLERASGRRQAEDLIETVTKLHNDALLKHGFKVEASRIQLVGALSAGIAAMLSGNVASIAITTLTGVAVATYQLLEAVQTRKLARAPALLVKAQAFSENLGQETQQTA